MITSRHDFDSSPAPDDAAPLPTHPRVLLAEDDDEMRWIVASRLRRCGYEVVECRDGLELADQLGIGQNGPALAVDLVISDIQMPYITGLEILRALLAVRTAHLPVILITSFGDSETHEEAQRLGAAAVVDKPFELSRLVDVVETVLPPRA